MTLFTKKIGHIHANFVMKPLLKVLRIFFGFVHKREIHHFNANFARKAYLNILSISLVLFTRGIIHFQASFVMKPLLRVVVYV